jgi:hypothetical protein
MLISWQTLLIVIISSDSSHFLKFFQQNKRLKDVEISFPIVYGTISFCLGKKASEQVFDLQNTKHRRAIYPVDCYSEFNVMANCFPPPLYVGTTLTSGLYMSVLQTMRI